jgi:SHS2 domain-containing protein
MHGNPTDGLSCASTEFHRGSLVRRFNGQYEGVGDYEILEHTADIGVLARGESLADVFGCATRALAEIAGIWHPGSGEKVAIEVESEDLGSLLVDWLSEVIYLEDRRAAAVSGIEMERVEPGHASGTLTLVPLDSEPVEGVQIKAVTYHQLLVERDPSGWSARVFFDI